MSAGAQLHGFPGGLHLPANKAEQTRQSILVAPPPARVVLPLRQHIGLPAVPVVTTGERVLRGQEIARQDGVVSASLHASVSGTVRDIGAYPGPHRSGLAEPAVVIDSDGRDEALTVTPRDHSFLLDDPVQLRQQVAKAGITGLGGAVFPTATKLAAGADHRVHTLILNGAECEPYISCDDMLMRERAMDVALGSQILLHILQLPTCLIALEEDKPEAFSALSAALDELGDDRIRLVRVPAHYPEGGERQLIRMLTGKEVPFDGLPPDIGYLCHNVGTAWAVARAILHYEPLISRIVSVCGPGIAQPRNVEARLGTPIADLVALCGGYRGNAARLVLGGPMTGTALVSDQVPVVKASNCVLVLTAEVARPADALPCIRCGECAEVCPALLLPQQLYWYSRNDEIDRALRFNVFDCIECGCCDQVCPSHIPLTEHFRYAKAQALLRQHEKATAAVNRERVERRDARLAARQAERQARAAARKAKVRDAASAEDKQAAVARAVERARAKRADASSSGGNADEGNSE